MSAELDAVLAALGQIKDSPFTKQLIDKALPELWRRWKRSGGRDPFFVGVESARDVRNAKARAAIKAKHAKKRGSQKTGEDLVKKYT